MSSPSSGDAGITPREREVWSLVADHLTNQEIADQLSLSVRTVESHVSALMRKMEAPDRRALARKIGDSVTAPLQSRWPSRPSSFVGREAEQATLLKAISGRRMVTVIGPGGVGKTRMVLQVVDTVAAARRDNGWFVDLVRVTDPAMVLPTIAASLGILPRLGGSVEDAVTAALAESDAVIVLDNCEHVLDAVRRCVSLMLEACPSLVLIATSRVRLRAPYEWVYEVPGMSPSADGDAAALFIERARSAGVVEPLDPDRVDVLCCTLDGMALAIELAAARCPTLGFEDLSRGLDRALRLLTTGAAEGDRHRSLRDTIAWSYDLLSVEDQELLMVISVFGSWFDASAVGTLIRPHRDEIEVADGLSRLADHSLIMVAPGDPTRYRALEVIRQFGAEQLVELGRSEEVHEQHRGWCRERLVMLSDQSHDEAWRERIDLMTPDVHTAIMRKVDDLPDAPTSELAELLAEQVLLRGKPEHSQRLYEQAAGRSESEVRSSTSAEAGRWYGCEQAGRQRHTPTARRRRRCCTRCWRSRCFGQRLRMDGDLLSLGTRDHRRAARRRAGGPLAVRCPCPCVPSSRSGVAPFLGGNHHC